MKISFIFYCLFLLCCWINSLPVGSVTPFCNTPQVSDSNTRWCYNVYLVSPVNQTSGTTSVQVSASYCVAQANNYASNTMQTLYGAYNAIVPSYSAVNAGGNGLYYRVSSICLMQNAFTVFNTSCRYLYSSLGPYDSNMPGIAAQTSNMLSNGYFTTNATRVYSAYCLAENDTSVATSLVMPNTCVVIFNNKATVTVCQAGLMEGLTFCDDSTGTRNNANYNGGGGYFAERGLALCTYRFQADNAQFNSAPACGSTAITTTSTYVSQTCGASTNTIPVDIYTTSDPLVKTISVFNPNAAVSDARQLDCFMF